MKSHRVFWMQFGLEIQYYAAFSNYCLTAKQKKIYGQFGITESHINKVADRMNLKV